MTPTNVLLTCAGMRGDMVAAFQAALAREGEGGVVVAADASPLAPTLYLADRSALVPRIDSPDYVAALLELCEQHAIKAVLPLTDLDQSILTARHDEFAVVGATVVASDPEACELCSDKWAAHCLFEQRGIGSPKTWLQGDLPPVEQIPFPVLVKARRGFAARHIYRAHDADELAFFLRYTTEQSMVQAFCAGEEFSIDLICDLSGRCLEAVPRSMIESKGGETIKGESLDDVALRGVAVRVAEALGIKGPACVQCFRDGDSYLVTDVNPRFGGGFPVHVAAGGGYPDLVLALARGEHPPPRLGSYRAGVTMVRYLTQVILERDGADALHVAVDDSGLRTPPAV
jgi:carbamoyl-phosphate synthase large subunit